MNEQEMYHWANTYPSFLSNDTSDTYEKRLRDWINAKPICNSIEDDDNEKYKDA